MRLPMVAARPDDEDLRARTMPAPGDRLTGDQAVLLRDRIRADFTYLARRSMHSGITLLVRPLAAVMRR
jgi:hypothetical protein